MKKMNKGSLLLVLFPVAIILLVAYSLSQDEPVDLSLSIEPCIGRNVCFIGEVLNLNVRLNPHDSNYTGKPKEVTIESKAFDRTYQEKLKIGDESHIEIPLSLSLKEKPYTITVTSNVEDFGRLLLKIKHLILRTEYSDSQTVTIRYPIVKIATAGYDCDKDEFKIDEVKLKLEEETQQTMNCKIRIYTDKLTLTNHPQLTEGTVDNEFHYYENNYSKINKADLTGAIQKVIFDAPPAIQQTNTRVVPVCLIGNSEVEIKNQEKTLPQCSVNQKSLWEKFLGN